MPRTEFLSLCATVMRARYASINLHLIWGNDNMTPQRATSELGRASVNHFHLLTVTSIDRFAIVENQ